MGELFVENGPPEQICSNNGPEFIATVLREWLEKLNGRTQYIEPESPWENGCCESFNFKLKDELLSLKILHDRHEAQVLIEYLRLF